MGELGAVFAKVSSHTTRIWKLLAYVGRYGHQPVNVAMRLTLRELRQLAEQIGQLVEEENAPADRFGGRD
jgi:hypothetical protein